MSMYPRNYSMPPAASVLCLAPARGEDDILRQIRQLVNSLEMHDEPIVVHLHLSKFEVHSFEVSCRLQEWFRYGINGQLATLSVEDSCGIFLATVLTSGLVCFDCFKGLKVQNNSTDNVSPNYRIFPSTMEHYHTLASLVHNQIYLKTLDFKSAIVHTSNTGFMNAFSLFTRAVATQPQLETVSFNLDYQDHHTNPRNAAERRLVTIESLLLYPDNSLSTLSWCTSDAGMHLTWKFSDRLQNKKALKVFDLSGTNLQYSELSFSMMRRHRYHSRTIVPSRASLFHARYMLDVHRLCDGLDYCQKMEVISLQNCGLEDEGLGHFAQTFLHLPRLLSIFLGANPRITIIGFMSLVKSITRNQEDTKYWIDPSLRGPTFKQRQYSLIAFEVDCRFRNVAAFQVLTFHCLLNKSRWQDPVPLDSLPVLCERLGKLSNHPDLIYFYLRRHPSLWI
jgi:hypothetical protein